MTEPTIRGVMPRPQIPACDRCTQGVMDDTNPHLWGTCPCECHQAFRCSADDIDESGGLRDLEAERG